MSIALALGPRYSLLTYTYEKIPKQVTERKQGIFIITTTLPEGKRSITYDTFGLVLESAIIIAFSPEFFLNAGASIGLNFSKERTHLQRRKGLFRHLRGEEAERCELLRFRGYPQNRDRVFVLIPYLQLHRRALNFPLEVNSLLARADTSEDQCANGPEIIRKRRLPPAEHIPNNCPELFALTLQCRFIPWKTKTLRIDDYLIEDFFSCRHFQP